MERLECILACGKQKAAEHSCFLGETHIHIADLTSARSQTALPQPSVRFFILRKKYKTKKKITKKNTKKQNKKTQKTTNSNKKELNHKIVTVMSVCPSCESY